MFNPKCYWLTLLGVLLIISIIAAPLSAFSTTAASTWPWGNKPEPFPWLDYLKSLPHEEGVTLVIITRHEATVINKAKEAFLKSPVAKELSIKNIIAVYAGPEQWETYIQQALKGGRPIDIAWGGGPTLFNYIDSKGYIQPLDNKTYPEFNAILYEMSKIPDRIAGAPTYKKGKDGLVHWIGAAISSFGITVNHEKIKEFGVPVPKEWMDLTDPVYAKLLPDVQMTGIADPTKSTSNTRMYEIILQAYGWDKGWKILTLMAANAKIFDSSSGVRDAVIRGDIAAGITIDFYGYTAMHQNPACEYIIPEGESIVNADPIAILKGSKHMVAAAAFVAWVLSEYGGQQVWLDTDINRLPINAKVFDTPIGKERQDLKIAYEKATSSSVIEFNETLSSLTERAMQFYFKATLVNAHDDLQSAWSAIAQAYLNGKITKEQFEQLVNILTKPIEFEDPITGKMTTFTLQYAIKINPKLTEGAIYQDLMNKWEDGARRRYREALDALNIILSGGTLPSTTTTITTATTSTSTTTGTTTTITTTSTTTKTPTTTTTTEKEGLPTTYIAIGIIVIVAIVVALYYLKPKK